MAKENTNTVTTNKTHERRDIIKAIEWPKPPKAIALTLIAMASAMIIGLILTAYEHGITEIVQLFMK